MRPFAYSIVASSILVMICCQSKTYGNSNPVSDLLPGDLLKVTFDSQGCFHHYRYVLTISKKKDVKIAVSGWASQDRILREITLTKNDVQNLDRLIQFYRKPQKGICTTVDKITITKLRNGHQITEEQFTDGSCETSSWENSITFNSIINMVDKNNEYGHVLGNENYVEVVHQPPLPDYPPEVKKAGIQGDVVLIVQLNKKGQITEITKQAGPNELLKSAETYVRSFVFKVNTDQFGKNLTIPFRIQINYRLPKKSEDSE